MTFGAWVKTQRTKLGYTHADLAEYAGIAKSYVWYVERGDKVVTLPVAEGIAHALGYELWRALREIEDERARVKLQGCSEPSS